MADLIHWPVPLNPKGNDPKFPKLPDGSRDIDHSWTVAQTWKQMEAVGPPLLRLLSIAWILIGWLTVRMLFVLRQLVEIGRAHV